MKNRKPAEPRPFSPDQDDTEKSDPTLGREIRGRIGHQLRAMYDEVVAQGVPERFRDLLSRLDQQGKK